jgi:hypothetical protein
MKPFIIFSWILVLPTLVYGDIGGEGDLPPPSTSIRLHNTREPIKSNSLKTSSANSGKFGFFNGPKLQLVNSPGGVKKEKCKKGQGLNAPQVWILNTENKKGNLDMASPGLMEGLPGVTDSESLGMPETLEVNESEEKDCE